MSSPLARTVRTYKALGHPVRLRLLAMLSGGELCVCQMTAATGLAASTVSAHLSDLKVVGLLVERKQGRWVKYAWNSDPEVLRVQAEVLRRLAGEPLLADDARLIAQLRKVGVEELCRVELDLSRLGLRRAFGQTG